MKEFIEKQIERLEELSIPIYDSDGEIENKVVFTDIAKNIVNELAEGYKNTSIITDFLQYARDNADNYDTNEGWSLADLLDLSIKYSEEYSVNTPQNSADGMHAVVFNDCNVPQKVSTKEIRKTDKNIDIQSVLL